MSAVGGTIRDGKIVLDRPVEWAEGTRVYVQLLPEYGIIEGVWPGDGSPSGEAEILKRMEEIEPLEFTPEEEAEFHATRETVKQVTLKAVAKEMGLDR